MDQARILADYRLLRAAGKEFSRVLMERLEPDDMVTTARLLGRLEGEKTIVLETDDEGAIFMDYAIHDIFHRGKNVIDRVLEETPPPEGSIELRSLRSARTSHYTVIRVRQAIPGFGVIAKDLFRQKEITVVDISFSQTAAPNVMMATRLHSPAEGWWMTTGAILPVTKLAFEQIQDAVRAYSKRHGELPPEQEMSRLIIRACLKAGASHYVGYADPGSPVTRRSAPLEEPSAQLRAGAKVGRNDPCPCGSGRKYKKCCG